MVFGEEVVLISFFQKLIYFRSHSAAIGCNCTTVQIVFCLKFAQSIHHPFSSVPLSFSSSEIGSFFVRRPPASVQQKQIPFQRSYRQGPFRCSYPQGHRLSKTATVDRRRACPSGCPRTLKDGVTASRRKAFLGIFPVERFDFFRSCPVQNKRAVRRWRTRQARTRARAKRTSSCVGSLTQQGLFQG